VPVPGAINAILLNEFLKEHDAFLEDQKKAPKLEAALAAVNQQLKEQGVKIEKVSARLEFTKAMPALVRGTRCSAAGPAITENHPGVRRGERLHTHKRASDFPSEFFLQFGQ
jgi:hypothetical protein